MNHTVKVASASRVPLKHETLANLSIFELVGMFKKAAQAQGESLEEGKSRAANKQNDIIRALKKEFKRRGNEGLSAVLHMTGDKAKWVRLFAAGFALRFAPRKAEPVLKELTLLQGDCGFIAQMLLKYWREGTLPPDD